MHLLDGLAYFLLVLRLGILVVVGSLVRSPAEYTELVVADVCLSRVDHRFARSLCCCGLDRIDAGRWLLTRGSQRRMLQERRPMSMCCWGRDAERMCPMRNLSAVPADS
jgi:hypothetical protein